MRPSPLPARNMSDDGGFTLLEISIALAILGMGVYVLLQSQFVSLDLYTQVDQSVSEEFLMDQALALAELDIMSGEESGDGDLGDLHPDYTYTYETQYIDDVELPGLMEVTLQVTGPDMEQEMQFRVYDGVQIEQ